MLISLACWWGNWGPARGLTASKRRCLFEASSVDLNFGDLPKVSCLDCCFPFWYLVFQNLFCVLTSWCSILILILILEVYRADHALSLNPASLLRLAFRFPARVYYTVTRICCARSPLPSSCPCSKAGVLNFKCLMPDDLRWSWCKNKRSKMHNECNALESSPNHPPNPQCVEKLSSTKLVPGAKKVGNCCSKAF